jgi:glycosyltransferase involved in cell wall biosynthesis
MATRIMICIDWFDPAYKAGGPVQSCKNLVKHLNKEFEFFILTSDKDEGDTTPLPGVTFNRWVTYAPNVQVYYAQGRPDIRRLIGEIRPAAVYMNSMYSLPFTIWPLLAMRRLKNAPRIILAPRGMLQEGAMKFKSRKKKLFLSFIRFLRMERNILFHATDEQEKADVLRYFPRAGGVFAAPNFPSLENPEWKPAAKETGELKCVFLSRIVPKKNLLFLIRLLQKTPAGSRILLDVWGAEENEAYAAECGQAVAQLPARIQVTFRGAVKNDELTALYRNYHVFLLATHGENYGHVIVEALSRGLPVIISDRTPWRGLAAEKAGHDISLDDEAAWLDAVNRFAAMSQLEYDGWSRSAHEFMVRYNGQHDPTHLYEKIFSNQQ